jgi:hypothetical protein
MALTPRCRFILGKENKGGTMARRVEAVPLRHRWFS